MSILLEAEHLTKIFTQRGKNPFKAVNDVSFTLKKGETLGIVGESGSGKSTIAKLLTRLTDITEGTLKFEGKDITRLKQSQLKEVYGDIQMVFQNPVGSFDPRRTLGDGIGESLRNRGMKKADVEKRVAELLEQCGLEKEYAKRYPHEVSGGQCQRAAIARALAVEPKVLICDEATSALDPQTTSSILALLKDINQRFNITIVIITHQMSVVREICSHVAIVKGGEVAEQGTVEDIFTHPQTAVARELLKNDVGDDGEEKRGTTAGGKEIIKSGEKIRIVFSENSAFEPVIANLILNFNEPVNILKADTKNVGGVAKGEMVLEFAPDCTKNKEMKQYLLDRGLEIEEVSEHVD